MSNRLTATVAKPVRLVVGLLVAAACLPALRTKSDEPTKAEKPAADSMRGKEAGDVRDDNGLKMKMVWCLLGALTMDQVERDENGMLVTRPVEVFLTHGYWLGKYEVTQAEWKNVMTTEPWKDQEFTKPGDDYPATFVSWDDAMEFCHQLTERERKARRLPDGWEYTLPTEAQWERACRARTETRFSFGDDESQLGEYAWFYLNASKAGEKHAHRVGQKKPNRWGFYDMYGNVLELCRDYHTENLPGGRDPEVTEVRTDRAVRGGWFDMSPRYFASGWRYAIDARNGFPYLGFRVALTPVRPAK